MGLRNDRIAIGMGKRLVRGELQAIRAEAQGVIAHRQGGVHGGEHSRR